MFGINNNNRANINSMKADFMFLNQMTKPNYIASIQVPSNLNELLNVLKNKNSKIPFTDIQRQKTTQQMNRRNGVDISKVKQSLKKAKQVAYKKQQIKKIQQDCHFYVPDMSYRKIDQYLQKAQDYAILSSISKVMRKSDHLKSIMRKNQQKFTGLKQFGRKHPQEQVGVVNSVKTQIRDKTKRQKYIKAIQLLATGRVQRNQFVNYLNNMINKGFWKIFARHIKCLQQQRPDSSEKQTYLYLESLKLVQQQYEQTISKGSNSLRDYIDGYMKKANSLGDRYIRDNQHKAFWGKIFVLYRAGRFREVYNLLGSRNQNAMITYIRRAEDAINKKRPIYVDNINEQLIGADIFRDQLIFVLRGDAKFSSQALVDCQSLDIIWVYLRSLAIYEQRSNLFEDMKKQLLKRYKKQFIQSKVILHNYLYLLCYDKIAETGLSQIMDQDDYLHFLICLYHNPDFINQQTYQKVQSLLTQQLIFTIKQLINTNRSQFIYYMSMIPSKKRVSQISSIISNSNLLQMIDWGYFMQQFSRQQYKQLVKLTLEKYLLMTSDYIVVAKNYVKLMGESDEAIKCLIKYLMRNGLNSNLGQQNAVQAQKLCEYYINSSQEYIQTYKFTQLFLQNCRKLYSLIQKRDYNSIINHLHQNIFIISKQNYHNRHSMMLNNMMLISGTGMDLYCKFVKNIVKGLELYYARRQPDNYYRMYVEKIREGLEIIFSQHRYKGYMQRQEAISVLEMVSNLEFKIVTR